jgi:hypothetical protein
VSDGDHGVVDGRVQHSEAAGELDGDGLGSRGLLDLEEFVVPVHHDLAAARLERRSVVGVSGTTIEGQGIDVVAGDLSAGLLVRPAGGGKGHGGDRCTAYDGEHLFEA